MSRAPLTRTLSPTHLKTNVFFSTATFGYFRSLERTRLPTARLPRPFRCVFECQSRRSFRDKNGGPANRTSNASKSTAFLKAGSVRSVASASFAQQTSSQISAKSFVSAICLRLFSSSLPSIAAFWSPQVCFRRVSNFLIGKCVTHACFGSQSREEKGPSTD